MKTKTFYRLANVPKSQAVKELLKAMPEGSKLVRAETKRATAREAAAAEARPGQRIYAAIVRVAEEEDVLDLTEDESGEDTESEAPDYGGESDESGESEESEGGEESSEGGESDDPFGEPEELTGEDKIIDLLQQLVDAVAGGAQFGPEEDLGPDLGPEGDLPPLGPEGDDASIMPEIGAPVPGEELPPPVEQKRGPAAFANVQQRVAASNTAVLVRRDVTDEITTTELIREAQAQFPGHKVAKVRRNGVEPIKGVPVDLKAHDIALVTLVKK